MNSATNAGGAPYAHCALGNRWLVRANTKDDRRATGQATTRIDQEPIDRKTR